MDKLISYIVRFIVWLSGFSKPLSHLSLCRYEEWRQGKKLKILLVGYNGARNTGADARVVALTKQIEQALGAHRIEITVMTLDARNVDGYFPTNIHLLPFTTMFFCTLLKACSCHHAAILCEGSTLTTTFAQALSVFYCQAAGIMKRQHKPCIAYGTDVGELDRWLVKLSRNLCKDTYFIVRTEASLQNLKTLGLKGHVGTDTAWPFQASEGEEWAHVQLQKDGWDGQQPLLGVAVLNPYWWPVRPSLWRWVKAQLTGNHTRQYDKMYFFSDSPLRQQQFKQYLSEIATAINSYARKHNAFVVILGMEKLDAEACRKLAGQIEQPHAVYTSGSHDVVQMTGLIHQLTTLVTSRYHAAVLSMSHAIPLVAVSMDGRLDGVIRESELADGYLHHVNDNDLGKKISASLSLIDMHREDISAIIYRHQILYEQKVQEMAQFFKTWLKEQFS